MQKTAIKIIKRLQAAGYEAYLVGGCVRDILMKVEPVDYDIVTSAKPEEIDKILPKTIPIGKKFGVVLAIEGKHHFEIATFRADSFISDGRRPREIFFSSAREDALRRDFTINGLFYDPIKKEIIDYVEGQEDIKNRIIRFIGDAEKRIHEDYLRVLRAVRFKINLQFRYSEETKKILQRHAYRINTVSAERIRLELNKILASSHRHQGIEELSQTGLLHYILPEVDACKEIPQPNQYHQEGDVYIHILLALESLSAKIPLYIIWAVLLHDIGKPFTFSSESDRIHFDGHTNKSIELADKILKRLAFSNNERSKILWLIQHHMHIGALPNMRRVKQHDLLTHELFPALLKVFRADIAGSKPRDWQSYKLVKKLYKQEKMLLLSQPAKLLTGGDIMQELNLKPGPKIGQLLELVKEAQLQGIIKSKGEALQYLKNLL